MIRIEAAHVVDQVQAATVAMAAMAKAAAEAGLVLHSVHVEEEDA